MEISFQLKLSALKSNTNLVSLNKKLFLQVSEIIYTTYDPSSSLGHYDNTKGTVS